MNNFAAVAILSLVPIEEFTGMAPLDRLASFGGLLGAPRMVRIVPTAFYQL